MVRPDPNRPQVAIAWDAWGERMSKSKRRKVSKCTMCVHRQDAGLTPACATACLTGAIQFVEDFTGDTESMPDGFNDPALTNPNIDFVLAG